MFQLFDHIASCLDNFTKEHKVSNETLPLGFTFSFPVKQEGLKKGVLISWTKGFSCEGVVGQDVVEMLKVACERKMVIFLLVLFDYFPLENRKSLASLV